MEGLLEGLRGDGRREGLPGAAAPGWPWARHHPSPDSVSSSGRWRSPWYSLSGTALNCAKALRWELLGQGGGAELVKISGSKWLLLQGQADLQGQAKMQAKLCRTWWALISVLTE